MSVGTNGHFTTPRPGKATGRWIDKLSQGPRFRPSWPWAIGELLVQPDLSRPGHFFLAADSLQLHEAWAATRPGVTTKPPTNPPHRLTVDVRATIVAREVACP